MQVTGRPSQGLLILWHVCWEGPEIFKIVETFKGILSVKEIFCVSVQFSSVQSLGCVWLFVTPWIAARQASLSITISQSSLRLASIESMMPSSHLILCRPLLLLPPIPHSIRVFSNESALRMRWPKYWSFNIDIYICEKNWHVKGLYHFSLLPKIIWTYVFYDVRGENPPLILRWSGQQWLRTV